MRNIPRPDSLLGPAASKLRGMSQESGPTPGLFSHTSAPIETDSTASHDKVQRPLFSSAPSAEPQVPTDGDR